LTEALAVAQQLNIVEERVVWQNQTNSISVNTQNLPDYTRGTKALTAEIASLKNRKSNDPFINGLRDLQEQLKFLANRLNIDKNKIQVVSIEQPAQIPAEPIKPKRPLIVVISFVLGLFFSIMVVLIKNAVTQARQPKAKV
jgi:chain length determinant protein (polysaccharide antigen chain regulator)